jgi:hypothetical protein
MDQGYTRIRLIRSLQKFIFRDQDLVEIIFRLCRKDYKYIAANIWKIYDFKIEVVPFIINFSTDLTTVVKF